jgi:hypothetical protein
VLETSVSGRVLHLSDVFLLVGSWAEERYDLADESGVLALGAKVQCSGSDGGPTASLELRLANRFSRLTFEVGQATNSETSDVPLVVDVIANSTEKRDNRTVPYNKTQNFDIDVRSVGAVKINFTLPCPGSDSWGFGPDLSVMAVVKGMTVTG